MGDEEQQSRIEIFRARLQAVRLLRGRGGSWVRRGRAQLTPRAARSASAYRRGCARREKAIPPGRWTWSAASPNFASSARGPHQAARPDSAVNTSGAAGSVPENKPVALWQQCRERRTAPIRRRRPALSGNSPSRDLQERCLACAVAAEEIASRSPCRSSRSTGPSPERLPVRSRLLSSRADERLRGCDASQQSSSTEAPGRPGLLGRLEAGRTCPSPNVLRASFAFFFFRPWP